MTPETKARIDYLFRREMSREAAEVERRDAINRIGWVAAVSLSLATVMLFAWVMIPWLR